MIINFPKLSDQKKKGRFGNVLFYLCDTCRARMGGNKVMTNFTTVLIFEVIYINIGSSLFLMKILLDALKGRLVE